MTALDDVRRLDLAVYRAIAATPTPTLDEPLRRLSGLANHSKLWAAAATILSVAGGPRGRRRAVVGLAAIGVTSAVVNLPVKLAAGRTRPDRDDAGVPTSRRVAMPGSTSFPSGHTASAFAFASAVGQGAPLLAVPLRVLAAVVGYSRVHTGVHHPGDVVVGALIGTTIGETVAAVAARVHGP